MTASFSRGHPSLDKVIAEGAYSATRAERIAAELAAEDRARAAADRARAGADRIAVAAERRRLAAVAAAPHLDDVTGVFRGAMAEVLIAAEIDRAKRSDGRLIVAFVDVDGLKSINDTEGRAAGDRALRSIGQLLRARTRSFDAVIRYGGDEFVCALGRTAMPAARRRFASISKAVLESVGVRVSVGLTAMSEGDAAEDMIYRARVSVLRVKAEPRG
jgi:diguanylate cyclase (GGDEF)-like protein